MRVVCPACQAAYEVPEARLGTGPRRLRCARCGHEWSLAPPPAEPAEPAPMPFMPPPPVPPPPRRPPPLIAERGPSFPDYEEDAPPADRALWLAWLGSIALLAALAFAAVQYRADVMQAWPPSQRAYALVGLAPG